MAQLHRQYRRTSIVLLLILLVAALLSMRYGAIDISLNEIFSAFRKQFTAPEAMTLNEQIFMEIRLPRAILCLIVGSALAAGGVLMQALFRNPIVEPGLVGTSSGAAFGAALYFVLSASFKFDMGEWILPLVSCLGGLLATAMVFILSQNKQTGKSSVTALLLTGIAINALFLSGVGFCTFTARDSQARSITYWTLGTLSGANWHVVTVIGIVSILCVAIAFRYGKHLNALMLGEEEAQFLGVEVKRLKLVILLLNVIMVAVATAFVGVISFVGLIVPHLLRIINGSDNRFLLRHGILLGAILLSIADLSARIVVRPGELPIGIVTSFVGVPVFIILLRKKNYFF